MQFFKVNFKKKKGWSFGHPNIKKKEKTMAADFGTYKNLTYRICFGLDKYGHMDYTIPHYEFHKNCFCQTCKRRMEWKQGLTNHLTVTTTDPSKFEEIYQIMKNYTCKSAVQLERTFQKI